MVSEHTSLLEATVTFLDLEDPYREALNAAAPSESLGADRFFEIFAETADAVAGSPMDAFDTACHDLERAAYGLGATEPLCSWD
jgi:hypothetical protein